ncbi:MAG: tetratricopeptide repeat protein [Burkholderiaceae bacterium]
MKHRPTLSKRRTTRLSVAAWMILSGAGSGSALAQGLDAPSLQHWAQPQELAAAGRAPAAAPDGAAVARLYQAAETAFQQQQFRDAQLGFTRLVAIDERHAAAWFRLGNLHQRASDLTAASDAYRRVLSLVAAAGADDGLRDKALMNLALLGLWRTRLALAELERAPIKPELDGERRAIEAELSQSELRVRALSSARRIDPSTLPVGAAGSRPAVTSTLMTPPDRRQAARQPVVEPTGTVDARRLGPPPRVEHFQGLPSMPAAGTAVPKKGGGDAGADGAANGEQARAAAAPSSEAAPPKSQASQAMR